MIKYFKKFIIYLLAFIICFQYALQSYVAYAEVASTDAPAGGENASINAQLGLEDWMSDEGLNEYADKSNLTEDSSNIPAKGTYGSLLDNRIILNPSDRAAMERMSMAADALPIFDIEVTELARLTGQALDKLTSLQKTNYPEFYKISKAAEAKYFTDDYLKQRLMASPEILARMFNTDVNAIVQQMQTDQGKQYVGTAIQSVIDLKLDKRVIETLAYLVRPKTDPRGGAGHSKIQVDRIWNNYLRDQQKFSRESEVALQTAAEQKATDAQTLEQYRAQTDPDKVNTLLADAGLKQSDTVVSGQIVDSKGKSVSDFLVTNEDAPITSAHHSGQAFDISRIDEIKCTLVEKRRIGGDKKTAQPPMDIKLLWQTTEGYNSDKQATDSSFNAMFQRMSGQSIADMLSNLGIDYENLDGADIQNFGDIMSLVGQQFLADALNAPTGSDIWKFNLTEVLRKIGGVVIADKLSLDNAPFIDTSVNSIDELEEAIGRFSIEQKLGLPYGSLKGADRSTILTQVGRERIIEELNLPEGSFNITTMSEDTLLQKIGSRIIEDEFGLPEGSFNKANLSEVANAISKNKLSMILSFPTTMDVDFGLADGTSARLKSGLALPGYLRLVAEAHILNAGFIYGGFGNCTDILGKSGNCDPTTSANDALFNLPLGTLYKFVTGTITDADLAAVGIYSISRSLDNSDTERAAIGNWLNAPNPNYLTSDNVQLQTSTYAATLGINPDDFFRIFGSADTGVATGTYKRIGAQILRTSLENSSYITSVKQDILASNPSLARTVAEVQFYLDRINLIKSNLTNLSKHSDDLNSYINSISSKLNTGNLQEDIAGLKQAITVLMAASGKAGATPSGADQITAAITLAGIITDSSGPVGTGITNITSDLAGTADSALNTLLYKVNAIKRDAELIAKSAYEMTTGSEQANFRLEDLTLGNFSFSSLDLGGSTVGLGELALFLSGQTTIEDFLLGVASAKLAGALGIPTKALKYAAIALQAIRASGTGDSSFEDIFFRAVGMAGLEESANITARSILSPAGGDLAGVKTISQIRDSMATTLKISKAQANTTLAEGLGLKGYNLQDLMSGSFGAWSTARAAALANDAKSGLPAGTTEKFITGKPLGQYDQSSLSDDNIRLIATKMHVSEASIKAFIDKRDGRDNPSIDNIYFVDHNSYTPVVSNTSATSTICTPTTVINDPTQIIADNSFYYFDQDGQHIFNSYAAANEYRKAHLDKVIDYINEIANSIYWAAYRFSAQAGTSSQIGAFYGTYSANETAASKAKAFLAKYPDLNSIKSALSSFLGGTSQYSFGSDIFYALQGFLDYGVGVPSEITQKVFTRSVGSGDNAKLDYLKISGYYVLQNFATGYINSSFGIYFGSERITPSDIYNMFDGNAMSVFSRLGGSIIDDTLNLQSGTTATFLDATDAGQRSCAMDNAAGQMLMNLLGIHMDLTGLTSGGLGQGKIETFLGLPHGSFKGANIDDLINNLTPVKFAEAFQIPMPKALQDQTDAKLKSIGTNYYNVNASKTIYQKIAAINNYANALGEVWTDINIGVTEAIHAFLADSAMFTAGGGSALRSHDGFSSYSEAEANNLWNNFRSRLVAIDSYMGYSGNETAQMLQGKISPDNYKKGVVNNIVTDGLIQGAIKVLGWDEKGITSDEIGSLVSSLQKTGFTSIESLAGMFGLLSKLFSVDFDSAIGLEPGTMANLIKNPNLLFPTLYTLAGSKIDQMLGFEDDVFKKYISTYFADDQDTLLKCGLISDFGGESFDSCLAQARAARVVSQITGDVIRLGENTISDLISSALNIPVQFTVSGHTTTTTSNFAVQLTSDRLLSLFHGDIRPLKQFGIIMALKQLYQGTGEQPFMLGDFQTSADATNALNAFRISAGDIERALYGDSPADLAQLDAIRTAAEVDRSLQITNANYDWTNAGNNQTYDINTGLFSDSSSGTNLAMSTDGTVNISLSYPNVPAGAAAPAINLQALPQLDLTSADTLSSSLDSRLNIAIQNQTALDIRLAGTEAVINARNEWPKIFQYKAMDITLHRFDKNIPPNFARRMFDGNSWTKTMALVDYFGNWLSSDLGWNLPSGSISLIVDYFHAPSDTKLTAMMNTFGNSLFNTVDGYLIGHSPSILGMTLEPGTFQGIVGFLQTGTMTKAMTLGSTEYGKSLSAIYSTDWIAGRVSSFADTKLGLPSGTTYQLYNNYQQYQAAKTTLSFYTSKEVLTSKLFTDAYAKYRADFMKANPGKDPISVQDYLKEKQDAASIQLRGVEAAAISMIVNIVLSKQIASAEKALGLVPGTGGMVVGMLVQLAFGLPISPISIAVFVLMNLFGVYKVELQCTADGYYPAIESPPDPSVWDNGNLGVFDGMDDSVREQKMIESAQYKANKLVQDLYQMPAKTGDAKLVPTQIMTGRWEDVNMWAPLTADTICKNVGSGTQKNGICSGTKAGMWANPQTTAYTHVGF